jgi:hypothetical protein
VREINRALEFGVETCLPEYIEELRVRMISRAEEGSTNASLIKIAESIEAAQIVRLTMKLTQDNFQTAGFSTRFREGNDAWIDSEVPQSPSAWWYILSVNFENPGIPSASEQ